MLFRLKKYFLKFALYISKYLIPSDFFSPRFPISLKGIVIIDNKILLLKDENGIWDLPGGKLRNNEIVEDCIRREIKEEADIDVEVEKIRDVLVKKINGWLQVFIVIYDCKVLSYSNLKINISEEHFDYGFYSIDELSNINTHEE